MKNFTELTNEQQTAALAHCYNDLLKMICDDAIEFTETALVEGIEKARVHSEEMRTPWFFTSMVDEYVGDLLRPIVEDWARSAIYAEPDDPEVIYGVIKS